MQKHKQYAFTLAEILITLGIIGIVAAMTMPALMFKIRKVELETSFKVTYARLTELMKSIENDYGTLVGIANEEDDWLTIMQGHSAGSSICKKGVSRKSCIQEYWHYKNGAKVVTDNTGVLVLANGATIQLNCFNKDCLGKGELRSNIGCVRFRVDTNGTKLPNIIGYDVFDFYVTAEGLVPRGDPRTNASKNGDWGRAYYLLTNGGRIDY